MDIADNFNVPSNCVWPMFSHISPSVDGSVVVCTVLRIFFRRF